MLLRFPIFYAAATITKKTIKELSVQTSTGPLRIASSQTCLNTNGNVYKVQALHRDTEMGSFLLSRVSRDLRYAAVTVFSVAWPSWNGAAYTNEIIFPTSIVFFLTCQFLIYNVSSWLENPSSKLAVNEEKLLSEDWTEYNRNKMFMQVLLD